MLSLGGGGGKTRKSSAKDAKEEHRISDLLKRAKKVGGKRVSWRDEEEAHSSAKFEFT